MTLWNENVFLQQELKFVEETMKKSLRTRSKSVEEALERFIGSGGKRLRPAFTILGATFGEYRRDVIAPIAAAVEIIHMATLIHDDIIDDAELRRGQRTLQSTLGKNTAVYSGDFLIARAFQLVAEHAETDLLKDIAKGAVFICDSEVAQNEQKYDVNTTTRQYLRRIGGKTAALFAISFSIGAHKAGCPRKLVNRLGKLGRDIGMAFQIVDDILDYTGDPKSVGKPLLSDAVQGIYTLPVLFALKSGYRAQTLEALEGLQEDKGSALLRTLIKADAIEKTKQVAEKYIGKARENAGQLPDALGKELILEIIDTQLERKF